MLVGRKDIDLDAVIAPQMDAEVAAKLKAMIDRRKLKGGFRVPGGGVTDVCKRVRAVGECDWLTRGEL